mmetsp:Transcript_82744/g.208245  ORF Transcript_82744/g.208245 Transcript_82744/m.208245 type:complete len:182 (-) Transcript_82744:76-621(-)
MANRIPVIQRPAPAGAANSPPSPSGGHGEGETKQWDVKDYATAGGLGATACVVTGICSLGTLAVAGVAAGVGYSAGQWIMEKVHEKEATKRGPRSSQGSSIENLPYDVQISLKQWMMYMGAHAGGCQVTHQRLAELFAEFEQQQPQHAAAVRSVQDPGIMQALQDAAGVRVAAAAGAPAQV